MVNNYNKIISSQLIIIIINRSGSERHKYYFISNTISLKNFTKGAVASALNRIFKIRY